MKQFRHKGKNLFYHRDNGIDIVIFNIIAFFAQPSQGKILSLIIRLYCHEHHDLSALVYYYLIDFIHGVHVYGILNITLHLCHCQLIFCLYIEKAKLSCLIQLKVLWIITNLSPRPPFIFNLSELNTSKYRADVTKTCLMHSF